ncbi:MAG TPA: TIGR04255 family protein, partial [Burkholderiales bacterium]|nr:TIGR04255 family protein [Burkholderiales bacterium]
EGFLARIVVPHAETGSHIAMSQMLEAANPQTGTVPVIIDIDVFKETELPVDSGALWEILGKMRHVKNQAFFDSVTPRCLELFK